MLKFNFNQIQPVKDYENTAVLLTRSSLPWGTTESNTISYIFNSSDFSFTDKAMPLDGKLRKICDRRQCFILYDTNDIIIWKNDPLRSRDQGPDSGSTSSPRSGWKFAGVAGWPEYRPLLETALYASLRYTSVISQMSHFATTATPSSPQNCITLPKNVTSPRKIKKIGPRIAFREFLFPAYQSLHQFFIKLSVIYLLFCR